MAALPAAGHTLEKPGVAGGWPGQAGWGRRRAWTALLGVVEGREVLDGTDGGPGGSGRHRWRAWKAWMEPTEPAEGLEGPAGAVGSGRRPVQADSGGW